VVSDRAQNPPVKTAARVVTEAAAALSGSERGGVRVEGLVHYGAVDLHPQHLVVWILLSGKPDEQLPEWMQVVPEQVNPGRPIDYQWLLQLRDHIVHRFLGADWPQAQEIRVFAYSSNRVDAGGGFLYFKG
jgi:hypothetical protein